MNVNRANVIRGEIVTAVGTLFKARANRFSDSEDSFRRPSDSWYIKHRQTEISARNRDCFGS